MTKLVLLVCLALSIPAAARAQDDITREDIALQNEILDLRHELDAVKQQLGARGADHSVLASGQSGGTAPSAAAGDITATLLDRVARLEDTVRDLQGAIDDLKNTEQQHTADLTKQLGDLTFRVQTLENGHGPTPADNVATAPPSDSAPPDAPAPPPKPQPPTLQQAQAALARHDTKNAESRARALIAAHGPDAYEARFILAEALAADHNDQQAALAFDDTYNASHKGPHAADSLVGLAKALAGLGDKPAACATLRKMDREFPDPRPDVKAKAAAVAHHAACS